MYKRQEEALAVAEKIGFNTNLFAIHPFKKEIKLPIYIANFVLMDYGTGAIFGCPAHDQRDLDFANKYKLNVLPVVRPKGIEPKKFKITKEAYTEDGILFNSDFLNNLTVNEAIGKAIENAEKVRMRHAAILVAIAATEYRIVHDSLPEKADSLVPDFLPCLPKDTFIDTSRIRYSSKDDGVAIYSVGPNGKDDGGPGPEIDEDQPKNDDVGIFLRKSPPS